MKDQKTAENGGHFFFCIYRRRDEQRKLTLGFSRYGNHKQKRMNRTKNNNAKTNHGVVAELAGTGDLIRKQLDEGGGGGGGGGEVGGMGGGR
jgi:hypothetical protein